MAIKTANNQSMSAITALPSGVSANTLILIKTLTASSDSDLSFVNGTDDVVLDNTYSAYLFKCIDIHPSSDGQEFMFNFSVDSGSNYNVAKTSTAFNAQHDEADSDTGLSYQTSQDLAQVTTAENFSNNWGNDNDQSGVACLWLFNPSSTTFVKHFLAVTNEDSQTSGEQGLSQQCYTAGYLNTTSAVDAIKFNYSSGNIDAGTIKLYGIKDS